MKTIALNTAPPLTEPLDVERVRCDFPALATTVRGHPLVYLDNAATTHKPWRVINRMREFDAREYATIHRGVYKMSEEATGWYHEARVKIARFIGADSADEVVFTSGATQSINLVAASYGRTFLKPGDEVIISHMEHHANIVPWQIVCREKGATLKVIPVNDNGELSMEEYERLLTEKTKIVAVTHVANAIGTVNPVKRIAGLARRAGAVSLVDGAQAVAHARVDVRDIGCDFYAFSGHKMYGPTGVGVLYGRREILESMPPYVTGGDMIERVTLENTTFLKPPHRFEAGTPPISQAIGLGEAVDYLEWLGMDAVHCHEMELLQYGTDLLESIDGLRIIGRAGEKSGIISFVIDNAHPHDVATILDMSGIAVRAGHHCAQPLMDRFGVDATTRVSVSFYNTFDELNAMAAALGKAIRMFE